MSDSDFERISLGSDSWILVDSDFPVTDTQPCSSRVSHVCSECGSNENIEKISTQYSVDIEAGRDIQRHEDRCSHGSLLEEGSFIKMDMDMNNAFCLEPLPELKLSPLRYTSPLTLLDNMIINSLLPTPDDLRWPTFRSGPIQSVTISSPPKSLSPSKYPLNYSTCPSTLDSDIWTRETRVWNRLATCSLGMCSTRVHPGDRLYSVTPPTDGLIKKQPNVWSSDQFRSFLRPKPIPSFVSDACYSMR